MCHNVSLLLKSKSPVSSGNDPLSLSVPPLSGRGSYILHLWFSVLMQKPGPSSIFLWLLLPTICQQVQQYNCQLCLYADKSGVTIWTRTGHTIMCLHVSQLFSLFVIWNVIRFFRGLLQKIQRSTCYCKQIDYQVSRLASLVL